MAETLYSPSTAPAVVCSAPGSLMISGEHAVLHNHPALVGAVSRRVTVALYPRYDRRIEIYSALGRRGMSLAQIDASRPFHFIGEILKRYAGSFECGFDLVIDADFPHDTGLGSSSAVTVATLTAVLTVTMSRAPERERVMRESVDIIRAVQGRGSGADVAASVFGGILLYRQSPEIMRQHTALPPLTLVYAGYKTPTPEVIRIVEEKRRASADGFKTIFDRFNIFTLAADKAISDQDWSALGNALSRGQLIMEMLGVCDAALADILAKLSADSGIYGAKISGSGLGDCVIGIGTFGGEIPYRIIPVEFSLRGLEVEFGTAGSRDCTPG